MPELHTAWGARPRSRRAGPTRFVPLLLGAVFVAGGANAARAADESQASKDEAAQLMVAEMALQRGDCRAASDTYLKAALRSTDARLFMGHVRWLPAFDSSEASLIAFQEVAAGEQSIDTSH